MHIAKRQKMSCLIVSGILAASSLFAMATMPAPASAEPKDNPTIFLFSGGLSDPFFGAIKKGADDAAKALGTTYQYLTITDRSDVMGNYTRLLEQSYARKPDVMIASVFFPAAMDPIVTKGVADGVPTFFMNSGLTSWKKDGAIAYIGEEPFTVGKQAGDVMAKAGVKHALCINHVPGNPLLELRCDGLADALKAGGAKVQVLAIPSEQAQNPQAVLQAIKGVLQATPTIDGIFTLGSAQSVNAIKATDELGITEKVFVGTVDISNLNLQLVQQKKMRFILDQQPYIQGFYSIVAAYQYARYRVFPIGQIVTSPFIITPDNVEEILAINKKYGGVRGAL